jgi:hypothetical protein
MAEAKTKASTASVTDFIAGIADDARRKDCKQLVKWMRAATGCKPVLWGSGIVGFGRYRYNYASGHTGDWPVIAFAPRKNDLSVYVMPGFDSMQTLLGRLGPHKTGKSCLYLKSLAAVEGAVLQEIITLAVAGMAEKRVE